MKKLNYKYIVISVVVLFFVCGIFLIIKNKNKFIVSDDVLYNIFPYGNQLVELKLGTYYKEKQNSYCKIKLPGNYSGWAMYLNSKGENITFEMANSNELSYSIKKDLLKQEEAVQQVHYSNENLGSKEVTDIYVNVFTNDQITYVGMKTQTVNAVEIKDNAFYSEGDSKYTDIDVTLYYRVNDDITLQVSYKGPLAEQIGIESIAKQLYKCIEIIK